MKEIQGENNNEMIENILLSKPIFNIDLFSDIPKEKNSNSKNIYLKYYNEHTKKRVLQNITNTFNNNPYYEQNKDYIKQKQLKNQIKKENERKKKEQIEKERSLEYRQKRMTKLYSSKKLLNNNNNNIIIDKSKMAKNSQLKRRSSMPNKNIKNNISNHIKILDKKNDIKNSEKKKLKMNLSFDDRINSVKNKMKQIKRNDSLNLLKTSKNIIVLSQHKYIKKLRTMSKLRKIYEEELNLLKNDKNINSEKQNNLILLLNSINEEIERFKNKIDILIIE